MKLIDSIITKRKLSNGEDVWCDREVTKTILEKGFCSAPSQPLMLGPLTVTMESGKYVLEGSTNPSQGLIYLLVIIYNGEEGIVESAVLVNNSSNPKFCLSTEVIQENRGLMREVKDAVGTYIMELITSPKPEKQKSSQTSGDEWAPVDLNATPRI